MPHLHHAGLWTPRSVLPTLILAFTALVYLRGWQFLRSSALKATSAWHAFSFLPGLFFVWVAVASPVAALESHLSVARLQFLDWTVLRLGRGGIPSCCP